MWLDGENSRLRTYREFCELLMSPVSRVWLDRLFLYYLETGRAEKLERVRDAIASIQQLSDFLDRCVGGGDSLLGRLTAEGIEAIGA